MPHISNISNVSNRYSGCEVLRCFWSGATVSILQKVSWPRSFPRARGCSQGVCWRWGVRFFFNCHHEPAEPRKRKKEGRKATSQKQNNPRVFNGSNISNIFLIFLVFLIDNRYSGYIGNQMLFGWVTQVALSLSLGIHLAVAGGSRPTLSFLGPRPFSYMSGCVTEA
jgi:hypothetical protein